MAESKKMLSVEDRLRLLYDLQLIDTRIHKLENLRGELPLEVKFFEDEIEGLQTRIDKYREEIDKLNKEVINYRNLKEKAKEGIERYTEMLKNARNDREYKSLQEEIDYFEEEIKVSDKRIKEALVKISQFENEIKEIEEVLEAKKKQLEEKKKELDDIIAETKREEEELDKLREEYRSQLPERLLRAYDRLTRKFKNRLAVVSYDRDSAGGSYFVIPPQMKLEIRERDRIIVDEHTGRILVDPELAAEEKERMQEIFNKFGNLLEE
jgi:predicted  nucleic acid-binding Zn-ribbon protein